MIWAKPDEAGRSRTKPDEVDEVAGAAGLLRKVQLQQAEHGRFSFTERGTLLDTNRSICLPNFQVSCSYRAAGRTPDSAPAAEFSETDRPIA
jgi:hypothetical protein